MEQEQEELEYKLPIRGRVGSRLFWGYAKGL